MENVQWSGDYPWDEETYATRNGQLEAVKWHRTCARENNIPWDEGSCSQAAIGGHLAINGHVHMLLKMDIWKC